MYSRTLQRSFHILKNMTLDYVNANAQEFDVNMKIIRLFAVAVAVAQISVVEGCR